MRGNGVQYYDIHFCSTKEGFAVPGGSHLKDEERFGVRGEGVQYYDIRFCSTKEGFAVPGESHS